MNSVTTIGIVLSRINYQESDKILTILSPDQGKITLIAKGVRKEKSKLAGGVELFSICEISFIRGRGEVGTLVSSRLKKHFPMIIKDIDRTMYAYDFLKLVNKLTEDNAAPEYFNLTSGFLEQLDNLDNDFDIIKIWADMQILETYGHSPELHLDIAGDKLIADKTYEFDFEQTAFSVHPNGLFGSGHIKLMRLANGNLPSRISSVEGIKKLIKPTQRLTESIRKTHLQI